MFGKRDKSDIEIENLKKKQTELTGKVNLLQAEVRRLREEIATIETTKKQVNSNKTEIESIIKEIENLQKSIKDELGKLSKKTKEIQGSTPQLSSGTSQEGSIPPPPPMGNVPPPPPIFKDVPVFKAKGKNPVSKTIVQEPPKKDPQQAQQEMLEKIKGGGIQLKTSGKEQVKEKTEEQLQREKEEEIQRYQSSIALKEQDIERLINQVSEVSTNLKTAKASQGEYEKAAQSQTELLTQLKQKKGDVEGKLKTVKERVGTEIEKIEEKRRLEEEKKQREEQERIQREESEKSKQQNSSSETDSVPDNIPPPPMLDQGIPPPPPMFGLGNKVPQPPPMPSLGAKTTKKETVSVSKSTENIQEEQTSSAPSGSLDIEGIQQKAIESQKKQEAQAIKDHLVTKLIDLALKIGDEDIEDVKLEPNEQQLFDIIGQKGLDELRESLEEGVENLPKKEQPSFLLNALAKRRGVIKEDDEESNDLLEVRKNKDKREIKEAVSKFISSNLERATPLLEASKDIKQREEVEAKRLEEARKLEEEKARVEREKKLVEEKRITEEKKAREVQEKLKEMGVQEGVVNSGSVHQAQSDKDQTIQEVSSKKTKLDKTDDFLSGIDDELDREIEALLKAEENRETTLETIDTTKKEEVDPIQEEVVQQQVETVVALQEEIPPKVHQEPLIEMVEEQPQVAEALKEKLEEVPQVVKVHSEVQPDNKKEPVIEKQVANITADKKENNPQKLLLEKVKFDKHLVALGKKAAHLEAHGYQEAAKEAKMICHKLINLREDFIHQKNGVTTEKFIEGCEKSIDSNNTRKLSESRGFFGGIKRIVHAVVDALRGDAPLAESKKTSMERISDVKSSLQDLKKETQQQEVDEMQKTHSFQSSM